MVVVRDAPQCSLGLQALESLMRIFVVQFVVRFGARPHTCLAIQSLSRHVLLAGLGEHKGSKAGLGDTQYA